MNKRVTKRVTIQSESIWTSFSCEFVLGSKRASVSKNKRCKKQCWIMILSFIFNARYDFIVPYGWNPYGSKCCIHFNASFHSNAFSIQLKCQEQNKLQNRAHICSKKATGIFDLIFTHVIHCKCKLFFRVGLIYIE